MPGHEDELGSGDEVGSERFRGLNHHREYRSGPQKDWGKLRKKRPDRA